jgi:hypothetical protein
MPERRFIGPSKTFERDITNYINQALNKLLWSSFIKPLSIS